MIIHSFILVLCCLKIHSVQFQLAASYDISFCWTITTIINANNMSTSITLCWVWNIFESVVLNSCILSFLAWERLTAPGNGWRKLNPWRILAVTKPRRGNSRGSFLNIYIYIHRNLYTGLGLEAITFCTKCVFLLFLHGPVLTWEHMPWSIEPLVNGYYCLYIYACSRKAT